MGSERDNLNDAETGPLDPGSPKDGADSDRLPPGESGVSGMIVGDAGSVGLNDESVPERIGPYRIHGPVGRGGMGTVYKASHDTDPGKKLVALKLVRRGMDTEDVIQRFKVERHVLSGLSHPYIARFFEAGEADDGRPYFVMEYVEGQPVTAYCDTNNLGIPQRLDLFRKICEAVHHAHTNLVVHRDLKPENIVVTPAGDPKLLDFGIAKLLNPNLAVAIAVTGPAMRLMTPEYASPEQVRGDPISTLSDVYSLGVLLYELLSGHRPYHIATRLQEEIVRVICESVPDRPSTVITRIGSIRRPDGSTGHLDPETIAKWRGGRPDLLRRTLEGDLDDIVLHAMSKAPAERYPSAQDMSEDLARFLRGDPVDARRARRRAVYVARKFVKRHRTLVAAAGASLAVVLIMGSVAFGQYRQRLQSELDAANAAAERERQAALAAQEIADAEREAAQAQRSALVRAEFGDVLWDTFGNRIIDVGLASADREALWQQVIESFESLATRHGDDNPIVLDETARAYKELADALGGRRTGNVGDSDGALGFYSQASDVYARLLSLDPTNDDVRYRHAIATLFKGDLLRDLNRSADAAAAYDEAKTLLESMDPAGPQAARKRRGLMATLLNHAQMAGRDCQFDRAVELCNQSIAIREEILSEASDDPGLERAQRWLAIGKVNLGEILVASGEPGQGEEAFRAALGLRRAILDRLGADKRRLRDVAVSSYALSIALSAQERHDAALRALDEADALLAGLVDEDPGDVTFRVLRCMVLTAIAENQRQAGRRGDGLEAAEQAARSLDDLERLFPKNASNDERRADLLAVRGELQTEAGAFGGARADLEAALQIAEALSATDAVRVSHRRLIARLSIALGDLEWALADAGGGEPVRREAMGWYRRADGVYRTLEAEGRLCGVADEEWERVRGVLGDGEE